MRILSCSMLALLLVVPACDSKEKPKKNDAKAEQEAKEAEEAKRIAKRREEREAKAAAKKKEEEERAKNMETLCVVPEGVKKPKKLDAACTALAEAQIEFLKKQYADDPEKLAGVEKNAAMQKANMLKMCGSMDIALGLKNAFENAPMGYGAHMNDLIATCMKKLGTPAAGGGAAVPKKPG